MTRGHVAGCCVKVVAILVPGHVVPILATTIPCLGLLAGPFLREMRCGEAGGLCAIAAASGLPVERIGQVRAAIRDCGR